jgi:hypothetical protein
LYCHGRVGQDARNTLRVLEKNYDHHDSLHLQYPGDHSMIQTA